MKLEPCRWDISACEVQFLLSQSLCFWLSFHCCEQLSKKIHSQYFWGGFVFIFSPVFPKDSSFLFFFCKQPALVPHIADDLKQSLPWRKIPGGITLKKTYKKALGGSVLSWIAVQVRESYIYIFKKIEIWKKKPRWFNWYSMKKATFPEKCWSILLSRTQTSNFLLFRDDKIIDLITTARLYYKG